VKLITTLALLSIIVSITQACVINIYPDTTSGLIGDTINITVSLRKQHLNCPLPLDSTGIEITGATLVNQTEWLKINIVNYEKTITLILDQAEQATIEVSRHCNIKSTQAIIHIDNFDPILINKQTAPEKNAPF